MVPLRLPVISAYLCSPIKVYVTPVVEPMGFSLPPLLLASSMVLLCLLWKDPPPDPLQFDLDATALLGCTWIKCGGKENLLCHWLKPPYPWGPVASMRSWIVGFLLLPWMGLLSQLLPLIIFCLGYFIFSTLVAKVKRIIITLGAYFCLFETGFCCVALAGLEFTM